MFASEFSLETVVTVERWLGGSEPLERMSILLSDRSADIARGRERGIAGRAGPHRLQAAHGARDDVHALRGGREVQEDLLRSLRGCSEH